MKAIYVQKGEALDYAPAENVKNGAVVPLGARIGIAAGDIPAGGTGTVHVEGVYRLAKAAGEAVARGAAVYYDAAADVITAKASGESGEGDAKTTVNHVPAGYAVWPAAAGDEAVLVKLMG